GHAEERGQKHHRWRRQRESPESGGAGWSGDLHEHWRRSQSGVPRRNSAAWSRCLVRQVNTTVDKERKLIIAGNWKMNKTVAEALDLVAAIKRELKDVKEVDVVVCPPFTALSEVSKAILDSNLRLGAQNMSEHNLGAYTGEIAAGMLKEFSVRYVILGHSERRQYQNEANDLIARKALAAHAASLKPIICVGETLAEREAGQTQTVLLTQVRGSLAGLSRQQMEETIIAYEPVWAIGT